MEHYSNTKLRAYLKYEDGLAVLDLKEKGLSRVPDAVTELSEIKKLVLQKNNLIELPASISKLKNLIVLVLDNNKITELPAEIGDLRELRELWVSNNQLVGLPTSIQRLTKLERLYLDGNKLTELPAEIGDLRKLRILTVSDNPLTVEGIRRALKLATKGVLVFGVTGKHSRYCSLINEDMLQTENSKSMVSFLYVLIHFN